MIQNEEYRKNRIFDSRQRMAYLIRLQQEYQRKIVELTPTDKKVLQIYEELDNAFEDVINKETRYLNDLL